LYNFLKGNNDSVSLSAVVKKNNAVILSSSFILGRRVFGNFVYVRPCFSILFDVVMGIFETGANISLSGSEGIGKSFFGIYFLIRLIQDGKKVFYLDRGSDRYTYFCDGRIEIGPFDNFRRVLSEPESYLVCDSVLPDYWVGGKILFVASAGDGIRKNFSKIFHGESLFMPTWTLEELSNCNKYLSRQISDDRLKDLYEKFGGIPRQCLKSREDLDSSFALISSIQSSSDIDLQSILSTVGYEDAPTNGFLHFSVPNWMNGDFTTRRLCFASRRVEEEIANTMLKNQVQSLERFLKAAVPAGPWGSLRGYLFEQYVHYRLPKGGDYVLEVLSDDSSNLTMSINASKPIIFHNIEDITAEISSSYWKPSKGNHPVIDAFVSPAFMLQCTVSDSHPIKKDVCKNVVKILEEKFSELPSLVFVVPVDVELKKQTFVDKAGRVVDDPKLNMIKQYVLKIDFEHVEQL
jgi:hypothetical protein